MLPILCLGFYLTKAQQTLTAEAFGSYTTSCNTRLSAAAQSKDYKQLLELTTGWLKEYEKQVPAIQNEFRGYLPAMYYNLACYQALEGQKAIAVTSFQKAVDAGYKKYAHAIKDSDLNCSRRHIAQKGDSHEG
ncbi:MAG: hypothetical protein DI535_16550 [Citrobacter freundii]|nr:MAG: hypothetical protein DI535_16550 [Citrobacter freundii]